MGAEYLFCHMLDNFNDPDGNIWGYMREVLI